jgi:hypothetical protein
MVFANERDKEEGSRQRKEVKSKDAKKKGGGGRRDGGGGGMKEKRDKISIFFKFAHHTAANGMQGGCVPNFQTYY